MIAELVERIIARLCRTTKFGLPDLAEEGRIVLARDPWIEDFLDEVSIFSDSLHD